MVNPFRPQEAAAQPATGEQARIILAQQSVQVLSTPTKDSPFGRVEWSQPPPQDPKLTAELKFTGIEHLINNGQATLEQMEPTLDGLVSEADSNAALALAEERQAFSTIDPKKYQAAKERMKQADSDLWDIERTKLSSDSRDSADTLVNSYFEHPWANTAKVLAADFSGQFFKAVEKDRQAYSDPTVVQVSNIEENTNPQLDDSINFRQRYAQLFTAREAPGDIGNALCEIFDSNKYATLKRQDRFFQR